MLEVLIDVDPGMWTQTAAAEEGTCNVKRKSHVDGDDKHMLPEKTLQVS